MIMSHGAQRSRALVDAVIARLEQLGYKAHLSVGVERTIIGVIGEKRPERHGAAGAAMPGIESIVPILGPSSWPAGISS